MNSDELLDLVSINDQVIGKQLKSEIYNKKQKNFRVINAFIFDGKSKIWIPKRHPKKHLFPLHLDVSIGGHVKAGETYLEALIRETKEEVNLDLANYPYKELIYVNPFKTNVSAFMKVYLIISSHRPNYNKDDFIEDYWLTPDELIAKLKTEPGKTDLYYLSSIIKKEINAL